MNDSLWNVSGDYVITNTGTTTVTNGTGVWQTGMVYVPAQAPPPLLDQEDLQQVLDEETVLRLLLKLGLTPRLPSGTEPEPELETIPSILDKPVRKFRDEDE